MSEDQVVCPHCGESISRKAASCRFCGSDDRTGWSGSTYLDGVDLPEVGEYEDGLEAEGFKKPSPSTSRLAIGVISVILIGFFALWLLRGIF